MHVSIIDWLTCVCLASMHDVWWLSTTWGHTLFSAGYQHDVNGFLRTAHNIYVQFRLSLAGLSDLLRNGCEHEIGEVFCHAQQKWLMYDYVWEFFYDKGSLMLHVPQVLTCFLGTATASDSALSKKSVRFATSELPWLSWNTFFDDLLFCMFCWGTLG